MLALLATALAAEPEVRTGCDPAGLPLVNFTSDKGVGYGAYLAGTCYGPEGSGDLPFRAQLAVQYYATTAGYAYHKVLADLPGFLGTRLRLDAMLGYEDWDDAFYFGLGNDAPRLPEADTPDGYYTVGQDSVWATLGLRAPLVGELELFGRYLLRSAAITVYDGTLAAEQLPFGHEGGVLSQLQLGLLHDTRDTEPNTRQGHFSELSVRGAHPAVLSDFATWGANLTDRRWTESGRWVFAARNGLDVQGGEAPFFHLHVMGGTQVLELGGAQQLRGLFVGRYRGNLSYFGTFEARRSTATFSLGRADFEWMVAPFVDAVRVWTWDEVDPRLGVHPSAGLGNRLVYNDAFIVRFDAAVGLEETTAGSEPHVGMYAFVGHPF